jgi:2-polyprenyl-3-methyl-5-hydroxy-6-metoxy-1,4-benzoquinol methylase
MVDRSSTISPFWDERQLTHRLFCPVCDKAVDLSVTLTRRADDLLLKRCAHCNGLFVDPCPSDSQLIRLYEASYFRSSVELKQIGPGTDYCSISEKDISVGKLLGHAEVVSSFDLKDRAVLEIGCATGALLKSLEKYEPKKLIGVDVSGFAITEGRQRYGLDLRLGAIESCGLEAGAFDLVIMIDVIEHVTRLSSLLAETTRVLKQGGAMIFRTPNADSYDVAGRRWNFLHCGLEHILYLSPQGLTTIAACSGLTVQKTWSDGCPSLLPYKRNASTRLGRFVAQPWLFSTNAFYRVWHWGAAAEGLGVNFWGILRKGKMIVTDSST